MRVRLTVLSTQIDMDPDQAEAYYKMRDEYAAMAECQKAWDTLERRNIDRVVERSAASEAITREPVTFALASCDLIEWEQRTPHFPNRTGGDLYIYPGFALYRAARSSFAIIDSREIRVAYSPVRFIEDGAVPPDAQIVGHAWAKSNRDGGPDRRFRDNYQMPVVIYGSLRFTSPGGLQEEFQVSNAALAERFAKAWSSFQASFAMTDRRAVGDVEAVVESVVPAEPVARPAKGCPGGDCFDSAAAFANESERARILVLKRGALWEFLLTQELLSSKLQVVERECVELELTLLSVPRRRLSGSDFVRWMSGKMGDVAPIDERICRCVNGELRASWGALGESGNALQILEAVDTLIGCCRAYLAWELDVRSVEPPLELRRLVLALRGITTSIVGNVKCVLDELGRAIEEVRGGSRDVQIKLELPAAPQFVMLGVEMEKIMKRLDRASG